MLGVVVPLLARGKGEFGWEVDELIVVRNANLRQNKQKKQGKKSRENAYQFEKNVLLQK